MNTTASVIEALVEKFRRQQVQPAPVDRPEMPVAWDLVIADLTPESLFGTPIVDGRATEVFLGVARGAARCRDELGRERYTVPLRPLNGRDPLADYLQEKLDGVVYLRSDIFRMELLGEDGGLLAVLRDLYSAELATLAAGLSAWASVALEDLRSETSIGDA